MTKADKIHKNLVALCFDPYNWNKTGESEKKIF